MGLDISAEAKKPGMAKGKKFYVWRKHHELMRWCEELAVSRGWEPWNTGAESVELLADDLDRLEAAVRAEELPDHYGRPGHWQRQDPEFIGKARARLAEGLRVELVFSW